MRFFLFLLICFPMLSFAKKEIDSNLSSIQIGVTESKMMGVFGKQNFSEGGPDIPRTHAYEVLGGRIRLLQSGLNNIVYGADIPPAGMSVFKQIKQSKKYCLVYLSLELNSKSMEIEKNILLKQGYKNIGSDICWYGKNGNALIIPPKPSIHAGYIFVLEASPSYLKNIDQSRDFLIRPQFSEYCPAQ